MSRQVSVEVSLAAGKYVIVPSSSGMKLSSVLSPSSSSGSTQSTRPMTLANDDGTLKPQTLEALGIVFKRLDEDMDGVLDQSELNQFMLMSEGTPMEPEVYGWLTATFDCDSNGSLTAKGFISLYEHMFRASGKDEAVLWRDLRFMGFDNRLELVGAREYILSIHTHEDCQLQVVKCSFDREANTQASIMSVCDFGDRILLDNDGFVVLYRRRSGYWGMSFGIENLSTYTMQFTMDYSKSENVECSALDGTRLGFHVSATVRPGEFKVLNHLLPKAHKPWTWVYKAAWTFLSPDGTTL